MTCLSHTCDDADVLTQVLAAQTRLAQELDRRSDLYGTYLAELLSLFTDKGVAVQTRATASRDHRAVSSPSLGHAPSSDAAMTLSSGTRASR